MSEDVKVVRKRGRPPKGQENKIIIRDKPDVKAPRKGEVVKATNTTIYYLVRLTKDLSQIDTSNVTDMSYVFKDFEFTKEQTQQLSTWDTSKVRNFNGMFYNCNVKSLAISEWNVSKARDMSEMFYACTKLNMDLSKWDIGNLVYATNMFYLCGKMSFNLRKWNFGNIRHMGGMFYGCAKLKSTLNIKTFKWIKTYDNAFHYSPLNQKYAFQVEVVKKTSPNFYG